MLAAAALACGGAAGRCSAGVATLGRQSAKRAGAPARTVHALCGAAPARGAGARVLRRAAPSVTAASRVHAPPAAASAGRRAAPSGARLVHATPALLGKVVPVKLPDIGEGIAEVEVLQWFVKPGDTVEQFDQLLEVQSDKATVEITSRYDGKVVKLNYEVGSIAPTGSALLDIEVEGDVGEEADSGDAPPAPAAAPAAAAPAAGSGVSEGGAPAQASGQMRGPDGKVLATPAVRRIARENDVRLDDVPATGKDGRVLKADILQFIASGGVSAASPAAGSGDVTMPLREVHHPPLAAAEVADTVVPVRGLQRAMVKSMTAAWTQPHFGYADEYRVDALMRTRDALKETAAARGIKLTYMPFFIKAASTALRAFPMLNANVNEDASELIHRGSHNIGVAMDSPRGLIVPCIKGVQNLSVLEIAAEMQRMSALAAEGKLGEHELTGTTFTLSSVGNIGGTHAFPVLVPGTVTIGALTAIRKKPRYNEAGELEPAHMMTASWSGDHRVVDGATLARFSNLFMSYASDPAILAVDLR